MMMVMMAAMPPPPRFGVNEHTASAKAATSYTHTRIHTRNIYFHVHMETPEHKYVCECKALIMENSKECQKPEARADGAQSTEYVEINILNKNLKQM